MLPNTSLTHGPQNGFDYTPQTQAMVLSSDEFRDMYRASTHSRDIGHHLEVLDTDIDTLDTAARALQRALVSIHTRRDSLVLEKQRYGSLLAPVRRLPAELLSQVLIYASEGFSQYNGVRDRSSVHMKLVVLRVCSRWRAIARSTPRMWSIIDISPERGRAWLNARLLQKLWLPLSGQSPLDIGIWPYIQNLVTPQAMSTIMQALVAHSARWQYFTMTTSFTHMIHFFDHALPFPLLESLSLERLDWPDHAARSWVFTDAPALSEVTLKRYNPRMVEFPSMQLAKLDISGVSLSVGRFHSYLRDCPNLRVFSALVTSDLPSLSAHLCHDRLEALTLDGKADLSSSIFSSITLPNLREVELSFNYSPKSVDWDHVPFTAFLSRSGCKITSLSLSDISTEACRIYELLSKTPTIEVLALEWEHSHHDGEALCAALTYPGRRTRQDIHSAPCILPMLRDLSLHSLGTFTFAHDTFVRMIWSRLLYADDDTAVHSEVERRRARLEVLCLGFQDCQPRAEGEFVQWRAAGLELEPYV